MLKQFLEKYLPIVKNIVLYVLSTSYRFWGNVAYYFMPKLHFGLDSANQVIEKSGYKIKKINTNMPPLNDSTLDLSIVVPVYNSEKYLKKCLMSLLEQITDVKYEIVCVNDGSKDKSIQILNEMKAIYGDKIVVHSQSNAGISAARNKGIVLARGKYIGFVDNDDTISPYFVDKMMTAANENQVDIVQAGYQRVWADGSVIYKAVAPEMKIMFNDGTVRYSESLSGFVWLGIYRKELFESIRFNEGYWYEDMITKLMLGRASKGAVILPECLYNYTLHGNNSSDVLWKGTSIKSLDSLFLPMELYSYSKEILQLPIDEMANCLTIHELCWQMPNRINGLPKNVQKAAFVIAHDFMNRNHIRTDLHLHHWNLLCKTMCAGKFLAWKFIASSEKYKSKIVWK